MDILSTKPYAQNYSINHNLDSNQIFKNNKSWDDYFYKFVSICVSKFKCQELLSQILISLTYKKLAIGLIKVCMQ